jgi:hypothetical protein
MDDVSIVAVRHSLEYLKHVVCCHLFGQELLFENSVK